MDESPSPLVYPLGIVLWVLGTVTLLSIIPPEARDKATGIVLFLLPLAMAILAAFTNLFARPEQSPRVQRIARTLTFAFLWPFVAWGQWDARKRK